MDFTLRCNSLKCRAQLTDRAVVTTCSHIFCVQCSDAGGLSNPNARPRICPACEAHLANPDDAVLTQLNPTEDYKTSVLSGLSPSVIMECAGRGLAFYSYQTAQEIVYQECLARSLTDKYSNLSGHLDKIIRDANSEITHLREKMGAMQDDQKNLEQRNQELIDALKDKTRSHQQVQKLYQTLKAQVMATQAASAASDDAENAINTVATNRFADHSAKATFPNRVLPFGAEPLGMAESRRRAGSGGSGSNGHERGNQHFGNRLFSGHGIGETPSSHRTRLPRPLASNLNRPEAGLGAGQGPFGLGGRIRQPLAETDGNSFPISVGSGYGMSAGMKMGRHSNFPINRPTSRVTGSGMPSNVNIR